MSTADTPVAPGVAPVERSGPLAILRIRAYRYLVLGTLFSQLANWIQNLGQGWLVYQLTGSAFQLSLVAFCQGAGMFIMSPIGGVFVDRIDRRKIMLVSQVFAVALAILLTVLVVTDAIRVWQIYLTSFFGQFVVSFNNPARQALVNDVVGRKDLPRAIALNSITMNTSRLLGPSLGGVMLASLGVEGTYAIQAAFLLIALGLTVLIVVPPRTQAVERTPFWEGLMSGVRYVRGDPKLSFILMVTLVFSLFGWPWQQLMPAYAREVLDATEGQYGVLMSCLGAGAMAAAFYITFRVVTQRGRVFVAALVLTGALLMALGLSSFYPLSLILLFALGACGAVALTLNQTLLQLNSEDAYRGRVISLYLVIFALQPMGTLPAGALADVTGTGWGIFAMGACLVALLAPVLLLSKKLRSL